MFLWSALGTGNEEITRQSLKLALMYKICVHTKMCEQVRCKCHMGLIMRDSGISLAKKTMQYVGY